MMYQREDTSPPTGVPTIVKAPCGATATWDHGSGCGYRCNECFAVLGSVGMPQQCLEENQHEAV